jgi:hypothetical protein
MSQKKRVARAQGLQQFSGALLQIKEPRECILPDGPIITRCVGIRGSYCSEDTAALKIAGNARGVITFVTPTLNNPQWKNLSTGLTYTKGLQKQLIFIKRHAMNSDLDLVVNFVVKPSPLTLYVKWTTRKTELQASSKRAINKYQACNYCSQYLKSGVLDQSICVSPRIQE